jgi:hypothetical protein
VRLGAPTAYLEGGYEIVDDIRHAIRTVSGPPRTYRSVLSIALPQVDTSGKPLAVVSVDCSEVRFFDPMEVLDKVIPLVSPAVNTIGLVLQHRRLDTEYGFFRTGP